MINHYYPFLETPNFIPLRPLCLRGSRPSPGGEGNVIGSRGPCGGDLLQPQRRGSLV